MKITFLLFLIASPLVLSISQYNYCAIETCAPGSHILCNRTVNTFAYDRCGRIIRYTLSRFEQNSIVNLHNRFRRTVYNGDEPRGNGGGQPAAASNNTLLEWDRELALAAQVAVQQCPEIVDECRNVARFRVSQSIGRSRTRQSADNLSIEEILWRWYNEVDRFNPNQVQNYSSRHASIWLTHHYTQMIWENTTRIGCAQIRYFDGIFNKLTFICNYGPSGNVEGEPIYRIRNTEH